MPDTTVTIAGNITGDPELRFTGNGVPVANFSVAVTPRIKDGDEWRDGETSFFRCNAWRELGENIADSLQKGDRVILTGTLKQRSWEDNEGQKRNVVEVTVDEMGPSLRWATAEPVKVKKDRGNGARKGSGDKQERRPSSRANRGSSRSRGSSRETRPTTGGDFDESMPEE